MIILVRPVIYSILGTCSFPKLSSPQASALAQLYVYNNTHRRITSFGLSWTSGEYRVLPSALPFLPVFHTSS
jgi:hypothetical protein